MIDQFIGIMIFGVQGFVGGVISLVFAVAIYRLWS